MNKAELRLRMIEWRRRARPDGGDGTAARRCARLPAFEAAGLVAAYLATAGEVSAAALLTACHERGKRLCVPAWCRSARRYGMALLGPDEPLEPGPMRILQPARPVWICPTMIDLIVVPGVAFDERGGRLGQGGGHYDRLLPRLSPRCTRVGLGHDGQVVARVPRDPWDEPVHWVVTEKRTLRCAPPARSRTWEGTEK